MDGLNSVKDAILVLQINMEAHENVALLLCYQVIYPKTKEAKWFGVVTLDYSKHKSISSLLLWLLKG